MRVFIFNNGRLKAITATTPYSGKENLLKLLDLTMVGGPNSGQVKKKKDHFGCTNAGEWANYWVNGLWSTLKRNLESVKFEGSKDKFKSLDQQTQASNKEILQLEKTNKENVKSYEIIDLFIDRGTGWIALVKDYSVAIELTNNGKLPDKAKLFNGELKILPWQNYSKCWLKIIKTSGTNNFNEALTRGEISTVPVGCGSFYGGAYRIERDMFEGLYRLSERLSLTVKCLIDHEWPAYMLTAKVIGKLPVTIEDDIFKLAKLNYIRGEEPEDSSIYGINNNGLAPDKMNTENDTAHNEMLKKMRTIGQELASAQRQLRFTISSSHFDDSGLDLKWYQFVFSGAISLLTKLMKSAKMLDKLIAPGASAVSTMLATEIEKAQQRYLNGGQDKPISEALEAMYQTLTCTYCTYLQFLIVWGLTKPVIGSDIPETRKKLEKLGMNQQTKRLLSRQKITTARLSNNHNSNQNKEQDSSGGGSKKSTSI